MLQMFKTMEKSEFRLLISDVHCFLMGKNSVQAKSWLDKCYSDSALLETTVKRWYTDFKCSHTDTNDAERPGHPNLAVVSENTKKIHKLVLASHKLKLREIAEELKISESSVFTILQEHLSLRKLCSKSVPRLLPVDQKQQCVDDLERYLQLFQCNKKEFLRKYVTMDEIWIHHFIPESNWQSAECTAAGESRPKRPKTQTSAGNVLASVFWDAEGILFIDYLEKGWTITSKYYIVLVVHLKEEKNDHKWRRKKCTFTHRILQIRPPATTGCLQASKECSKERDLAPMKKWYRKLRHSTKKGTESLEKRWNQCITLEGDYVDE